MSVVDLRSDTVTLPSPGMRRAMAEAELGDDVFGEDPTVNRLQTRVAGYLGKEAALFVPSGSMGNQVCIKVHTRPGDEVVVERGSHVYNNETAGMAFLSSVQVAPVDGDRGVFSVDDILRVRRPSVYYMPRTRLICIENTHNRAGGTIFPLSSAREISLYARREKIRLHLDGARFWNAMVATGDHPAEYAECFDSVSVCFSKGLGAPIGSAIAGTREFIDEARHYRKIFGGGMRQAGVLAAAALYAMDHHVGRLTEDHDKAATLAREVAGIDGVTIDQASVQTNMVLIGINKSGNELVGVLRHLERAGVRLTQGGYDSLRAVTHMDVSLDAVRRAGDILKRELPRVL